MHRTFGMWRGGTAILLLWCICACEMPMDDGKTVELASDECSETGEPSTQCARFAYVAVTFTEKLGRRAISDAYQQMRTSITRGNEPPLVLDRSGASRLQATVRQATYERGLVIESDTDFKFVLRTTAFRVKNTPRDLDLCSAIAALEDEEMARNQIRAMLSRYAARPVEAVVIRSVVFSAEPLD